MIADTAPRSAMTHYCLVRASVIAVNRVVVTNWIVYYLLTMPALCWAPLCNNRYILEREMDMLVSEICYHKIAV